MSATIRLRQLRTFLFGLAAALFAGSIVELIAVKHDKGTLQLLPFALCAVGFVAIGLAWRTEPVGRALLAFRGLMLGIAGGSLLGVWEHLEGNYAFAHDIHPKASRMELLKATFYGRNPFMAPGILAIGALIAVAATFAVAHATAASMTTVPAAVPGRETGTATLVGAREA